MQTVSFSGAKHQAAKATQKAATKAASNLVASSAPKQASTKAASHTNKHGDSFVKHSSKKH